MATYRLYKNGIFGRRYKKHYIIKEAEQKKYSVVDGEKTILQGGFNSAKDGEWFIDKITASPETVELIKNLYSEELYRLSELYGQLSEKQGKEGLTPSETVLMEYVVKVRKRKAEGKAY